MLIQKAEIGVLTEKAEAIRRKVNADNMHEALALLALIKSPDTDYSDDGTFCLIIRQATDVGIVSFDDIAKKYQMHRSTPSRWAKQKNTPHQALRSPIIKDIEQRVVESVAEFDDAEDRLHESQSRANNMIAALS